MEVRHLWLLPNHPISIVYFKSISEVLPWNILMLPPIIQIVELSAGTTDSRRGAEFFVAPLTIAISVMPLHCDIGLAGCNRDTFPIHHTLLLSHADEVVSVVVIDSKSLTPDVSHWVTGSGNG